MGEEVPTRDPKRPRKPGEPVGADVGREADAGREIDMAGDIAGDEVVSREVVPLSAEIPRVDTRTIETGRVRVATSTRHRDEEFDVDLTSTSIDIERVPVGREVDGPVEVRQEGDVTIVPVLEEVLVVRKQLMLKEEVRIRRRTQKKGERHRVKLRYQEALVERSALDDAEDHELSERVDSDE